MTDTNRHTTDDTINVVPNAKNIMALMLLTIADTTWRLFLPSVGGTALGLWADNSWDTKPWLTITGVTVGSILSFVLVYAQIKHIKSPQGKVKVTK